MEKVNIGIIGCGGFANGMHIPLIMKSPKFNIRATMDIREEAAKTTFERTGAKYFTTDLDRIMSDDEIDALFIITRHDSHASLSIKAAKAGKHVFCEKPMGLDLWECKEIADAVIKNNVKYTVGYNRGISPFVTKAKELLAGISDKKMIYHRIQANFSQDHWIHDRISGGGRIVGEGCHIFDLICEIVDKAPVSIYASGGIFLDPEKVDIPDSCIVTITFEDGSVGTTLISSAGCPDFPKEATEVYCNNKAIYINDFTRMEYFGFENHKKIVYEFDTVDKGQWIEINSFADSILNDSKSPNGINNAARAAVISYKVYESIKTGMPVSIEQSEYIFKE